MSLLTDVLRDEWGFEGFVISDWIFGVRDAAASVPAGLDVEMPYRMVRARDLAGALERDEVSWDDVDRSVIRVVATLLRFHEVLCPPLRGHRGPRVRRAPGAGPGGGRQVGRRAPQRAGRRCPRPARSTRPLGAWRSSANWRRCGTSATADRATCGPRRRSRWSTGWGARWVRAEIVALDGEDLDATAAAAASCDVALVVVGYTRQDEGEYIGGDSTAHLAELSRAPTTPNWRSASRTPSPPIPGPTCRGPSPLPSHWGSRRAGTASPCASMPGTRLDRRRWRTPTRARSWPSWRGSAVVVSGWDRLVPAIVQSWYGGMEGGNGLADVLLGRHRRRGPSPVLRSHRRGGPSRVRARRRCGDLRPLARLVAPGARGHRARLPLRVRAVVHDVRVRGVRGCGRGRRESSCGGRCAIPGPGVAPTWCRSTEGTGLGRGRRRARRLLGFARVEIDAGAHADVVVRIPWQRLAVHDGEHRCWVLEKGTYLLEVARHEWTRPAKQISLEVAPASSSRLSRQDHLPGTGLVVVDRADG